MSHSDDFSCSTSGYRPGDLFESIDILEAFGDDEPIDGISLLFFILLMSDFEKVKTNVFYPLLQTGLWHSINSE